MSFGARIVELGWLPGITLCGMRVRGTPVAATSSALLPNASAALSAKQFAINKSCWSSCSRVELAKPMKSTGTSFFPWCSS